MNITTNKLTASEVIIEINSLQYTGWTAEQRQERVEVMEKALNIINAVLEDISETDFNSRLYFSSQKGQVDHYLSICIDQVYQETTEEKFITESFEPFSTPEIEQKTEEVNPNGVVIGMILFWILFLLTALIS